jgi:hypothetical protein
MIKFKKIYKKKRKNKKTKDYIIANIILSMWSILEEKGRVTPIQANQRVIATTLGA